MGEKKGNKGNNGNKNLSLCPLKVDEAVKSILEVKPPVKNTSAAKSGTAAPSSPS